MHCEGFSRCLKPFRDRIRQVGSNKLVGRAELVDCFYMGHHSHGRGSAQKDAQNRAELAQKHRSLFFLLQSFS